jgi:hypothetical protein
MATFGFSISDFITVTKLALQLYDSYHKVVKEAPAESLKLCNELAALKFALDRIHTGLQRPESKIAHHSEDRLKSLKLITESLYLTLLQLAKLIDRYKPVVRKTTTATLWTKIR